MPRTREPGRTITPHRMILLSHPGRGSPSDVPKDPVGPHGPKRREPPAIADNDKSAGGGRFRLSYACFGDGFEPPLCYSPTSTLLHRGRPGMGRGGLSNFSQLRPSGSTRTAARLCDDLATEDYPFTSTRAPLGLPLRITYMPAAWRSGRTLAAVPSLSPPPPPPPALGRRQKTPHAFRSAPRTHSSVHPAIVRCICPVTLVIARSLVWPIRIVRWRRRRWPVCPRFHLLDAFGCRAHRAG